MKFTAKQLAEVLGGTVEGDPQASVSTFAKIEHGKPGQICFYANPKYEKYVYRSKASIILVNRDFSPREPVSATLIRVDDAYSALATLLEWVTQQRRSYKRHRGRCRIARGVKLGEKVWIGDFVTVGRGSQIGSYTKVWDNVHIGENVHIGQKCIIYPGVVIFSNTVIGDRTILHAGCIIGDDGFGNALQSDGTWKKIEHIGNVIIGNDVEIGSNTTVDKAPMESTIIGDGVRIDNLCQVAHNVVIGKNTVMAGLSGIAGSAQIGENCIIGGQSGIVGHITVPDHTTLGARTGLSKTLRKSGEVLLGFPAMPRNVFLRASAKFRESGEKQ